MSRYADQVWFALGMTHSVMPGLATSCCSHSKGAPGCEDGRGFVSVVEWKDC